MLRGNLDIATRNSIRGWAFETDTPEMPVALLITANDVPVARVIARTWRADLQQAGIGDGRHCFELQPGAALGAPIRYVVAVRRESDGAPVPGSPMVIEAPSVFDDEARQNFSDWLKDAETAGELEERVFYLRQLTEELLQARSDLMSRRLERAGHRFVWRTRAQDAAAVTAPGLSQRALVLDETLPQENHDAGSNALLSHVQAFGRLGFDVVLAAADMGGSGLPGARLRGAEVYGAPWFSSVEDILRQQAESFDLVYLHRVGVGARYLPLVRFYQRRAKIVFSVADLSHVRLARRARIEDRPELVPVSQARRAGEIAVALGADAVITHSSVEVAVLREAGIPAARIHLARWEVLAKDGCKDWYVRSGVALIGHYAHAPNVDAAMWLVDEVMPLVWARDSSIVCRIAGSAMPDAIRALARPGIEIIGRVEALSTFLGGARLTVAPLRYGAGVKGKVVDSLAAGVPCACTTIAMEGLDLPAVLAVGCDTPTALAARIVVLHNEQAINRAAAAAGLAYVASAFSADTLDAALRRAIE